MLTDEKYGRQIGALLRAEVADLAGPPDLLDRLRRARARQAMVTRAGLAVLPVAAVAIAASAVVASGGSVPAHGTRPPAARAAKAGGPVVRLADYSVQLPAGFTVTRRGAGVQARGPGDGFIWLFVESGRTIRPPAADAAGDPAPRLIPVTVDGLPGTMFENVRVAELSVRVPSRGAAAYLVAKATGRSAIAALPSFANQVRIEELPVVKLSCQVNCG